MKVKEKPKITIERATRNKKKCITSVRGLDAFGVKLGEAAKAFGKKFACGSSIVKDDTRPDKEQIDVQGDVMEELAEYVLAQWGAANSITEDDFKRVDKGK